MSNTEQIEKVRQAIMRYRELLDHLQGEVARGERRYQALFNAIPDDQKATLQEKLLQREAAILALEDMEPLRRALLGLQFTMRDLEREFEATYNNVAPEEEPEG